MPRTAFSTLTYEENQALHDELKRIIVLTDQKARNAQLRALLFNPSTPLVLQMRIHSLLADNADLHRSALWHYEQGLRDCLEVWNTNYESVMTESKSRKYLNDFGAAMIAGLERRTDRLKEERASHEIKCRELNVEMKEEELPSFEEAIGAWKERGGQGWWERRKRSLLCK